MRAYNGINSKGILNEVITMMTIHEISEASGVSVRALRYYDEIGLFAPTEVSEAGYRLYDDAALYRLQLILLFRELEFPLGEIGRILDSPDADRNAALAQQIKLLRMKKEHLENLITLALGLYGLGVKKLDFTAFDTRKIDEYERQAKASWGQTDEYDTRKIDEYERQAKASWGKTDEYKEYEQKSAGRTPEENQRLSVEFMRIFEEIGECRHLEPSDPQVQALVQRLKDYITEHFYTCSDEILLSLGRAYAGGGALNENIDKAGGEGTAEFACRAIEIYYANRK